MNKKACAALVAFVLCLGCAAPGNDLITREKKMQDNPFGVLEFLHWNHSWNYYKFSNAKDIKKTLGLMKEAGVGFVRMDFLWDEIEPARGEFTFAKYDEIVKFVSAQDIKILGLLNYSASWAVASRQWNCPPEQNEEFVNYAAKVIEHYKGIIKHWEVWNEPDSATYWSQQDSLKRYCSLLKDVYIAAKKANPECLILNGGLANGLASVNNLYDNGGKGYFDILNLHFFETPLNKHTIKAVLAYPRLAYKIMARNGDGEKKIWITEIGCPGVKKGEAGNWWLGVNPTEEEQAVWVKEVFTVLLKDPQVEKVFWAFFRDCKKHWDSGVDHFGLVRWDYSKKPAFDQYRKRVKAWNREKK